MKTHRRTTGLWNALLPAFLATASLAAEPSPWEIVDGLRQQMQSVRTVVAEYTIQSDYRKTGRLVDTKVCYVRDGAKLHIVSLRWNAAAEMDEETRRVDDGELEKTFYTHARPTDPLTGHISMSRADGGYLNGNDLLGFSGFTMASKRFGGPGDDRTFELLGTEPIGGTDAWKIRLTTPYKPGHKAANYFWISRDDSGYRLWRSLGLVDDDPQRPLYDRRFTYGTDAPLVPTEVHDTRYQEGKAGGKSRLEYTKTIKVSLIRINQPINPAAFVFDFPVGTSVLDVREKAGYEVMEEPSPPPDLPLTQLALLVPPETKSAEDDVFAEESSAPEGSLAPPEIPTQPVPPAASPNPVPPQTPPAPPQTKIWLWVACPALLIGIALGALLLRRRC